MMHGANGRGQLARRRLPAHGRGFRRHRWHGTANGGDFEEANGGEVADDPADASGDWHGGRFRATGTADASGQLARRTLPGNWHGGTANGGDFEEANGGEGANDPADASGDGHG